MVSKYTSLIISIAVFVMIFLTSCVKQEPQKITTNNNNQDTLLSKEELDALASQFNDEPFTGGQIAPRVSKWVNNNTFIFLQFDKARPENATKIRYIGIGVRGTFCKSKQPSPYFTHFHRPNVANYSQGHGGQPKVEGYWLMWVAVDEFDSQGRHIKPGVDEKFSPTPAPDC